MPLIQGSSPQVVQENIKQLKKDGYSNDQAVAIALSIAKKNKRKKRRK